MLATKRQARMDSQTQDLMNQLIEEQVRHAMGDPGGIYKLDVRPLWDGYYRINILIGIDATSLTIKDSFFLQVDGDGQIINSTPKIAKR